MRKFNLLIFCGLIVFFGILTATNWNYLTSTDFNNGTYFQTILDAGNFVRLANVSNEFPNSQAYNSTTGMNMTGNVLLLHMNDEQLEFPNNQITNNSMNMTGNVLLMHMNDGWTDSSGLGNSGTASGATFTTSVLRSGNASGNFDGIDDIITIPNSNSLNISGTGLSISLWVNPRKVGGSYQRMVAKGDYFPWSLNIGNTEGVYLDTTTANQRKFSTLNTFYPPTNTWSHIIATYNGSNIYIYVNGVLNSTTVQNGSLNTNSISLHVGGSNVSGTLGGFINATLDEVAIWNRSLSDSEVSSIYNSQLSKFTDSSGLSNNVTGVIHTGTAKLGTHSGVFDGLGEFGNTPSTIQTLTNMTMSAWIKTNWQGSSPVFTTILGDYGTLNASFLYVNASGQLHFDFSNGTYMVLWPNTYVADQQWHYVAITRRDRNYTLYSDGVPVASNIYAWDGAFDSKTYTIGKMWNANSNYWNGSIDEVAIWNRSLSASEISNIYMQQYGRYYNSGNYTSEIKDFSSTQIFNNLSWTPQVPYQQELPNNQAVESVYGGANMTGNVLLLHLNNQSAFGENDARNVSNSIYDFSGNNNNVTLGNATAGTSPAWTTSGKLGAGAYSFDGVNDYGTVAFKQSINITQTISVSTWVYTSSNSTNYADPISKGVGGNPGEYSWGIVQNTGSNRFYFATANATAGATSGLSSQLSFNEWHHLVGVRNSSTVSIYVDGALVSNASTHAGNMYDASHAVVLGRLYNYGFFNGSTDEVAIWNRSLSATEIQNLYLRGAVALNLSVRSCDDSACSGESWNTTNSISPVNLSAILGNNQYFQYKFDFFSDSTNNTSPQLYNVSLDYSSLSLPQISFALLTPLNNSQIANSSVKINFSILETNLNQIIHNWNGTNYTLYHDDLEVFYSANDTNDTIYVNPFGGNPNSWSKLGLSDSLIFAMTLNNNSLWGENATRTADLSGNKINGTATGGAFFNSSGKYGGAFQFDGTDDYISTTSNILSGTSTFTISVWAKPYTFGSWKGIIGKGTGDGNVITIQAHTGGVIYADVDNGATTSFVNSAAGVLTTGSWYHLVLVYNGTAATDANKVKVYVNGANISLTYSGTFPTSTGATNTGTLSIGQLGYASNYFNGLIDEVMIWNRSLSATEISTIYSSGLTKTNTSYWYFYVNQTKNSTTGLDDGNYSFNAFAFNSGGNSNSTETRNIFVDWHVPLIDFGVGTNSSGTNVSQNWIYTNVSVTESFEKNITFVLFNSTGQVNSTTFTTAIRTINWTSLSDGTYTYNVTIFDTIGNRNTSSTRTITLDNSVPLINLIFPNNKTSDNDGNLTFVFNATDTLAVLNCSLNFNNLLNQTNSSTIQNLNTLFQINSLAVGNYNWSINCTDQVGNSNLSETRFFSVSRTNNFSGSTTNLSGISDYTNITNFTIENPTYGKIVFNENISLSSGIDIDSFVSISSNRVEINSSGASGLNKSALLSLYGLTFSNPRILKDGVLCSSPQCVRISYSGGVLFFNVSSFSYYSAQETPSSGTSDSGDGGSGGGTGGGKTTGTKNLPVKLATECTLNSECRIGEICSKNQCVKLFDVQITEMQSLVKVGEIFNFSYFIKSMTLVNDDVNVLFWIEKDKKVLSSGHDVVFVGGREFNYSGNGKLLIPSDVESGQYFFYINVNRGSDINTTSYRTIEISVDEKTDVVTFEPVDEVKQMKKYVYILIGVVVALMLFIVCIEIRRARCHERKHGEKRHWLRNHWFSFVIILFLILAGATFFVLNWLSVVTFSELKDFAIFVAPRIWPAIKLAVSFSYYNNIFLYLFLGFVGIIAILIGIRFLRNRKK